MKKLLYEKIMAGISAAINEAINTENKGIIVERILNKYCQTDDFDVDDIMDEKLFDILVPGNGTADTVAGELVRAVARIVYRYYNDGDKAGDAYGKESVNPVIYWVCKVILPRYKLNNSEFARVWNMLYSQLDYCMLNDMDYESLLHDLKKVTILLIRDEELYNIPNTEDMFDLVGECYDRFGRDDSWGEDEDYEDDFDDLYEDDDYMDESVNPFYETVLNEKKKVKRRKKKKASKKSGNAYAYIRPIGPPPPPPHHCPNNPCPSFGPGPDLAPSAGPMGMPPC